MLESALPKTDTGASIVDMDTIHVLLVEDNEDDAMIVQAMLAKVCGITFDIEWVSNFRQGLEKLKGGFHDICLLDYCLGKETGLDLLGEALRFGYRVPIIMLTGTTNREIDLQAIKLGAADYVVKGETSPGLLERVIRHALERRKATIEREQLTQQLVETSRRLGMAEVATDVLHHIGNALNSLNVSAGLIFQHVRDMPVQDVNRASALLETHKDDLGRFFTQDRKGQRIPGFLTQLGDHLLDQHTQTCQDLETLISQIHHVKDIIAAQQDLTQIDVIQEPVVLEDIIENVLKVNAQEFAKYSISIIRDYVAIPQVFTNKQQIAKIVANMIRNAQDAIRRQGLGSHCLTIRIQPHPQEDTRIRIQVSDTGIGIPPDQLHRIFSQSSSKKDSDQGAGLHNNAIAAKNLGGALSAASDGKGHGATFTLELPFKFLEIPV